MADAVAPVQLGGLSAALARLLRVPPAPTPPAGTPDSLKVFRAAPRWVPYRMTLWLLSQAVAMVMVGSVAIAMTLPLWLASTDKVPMWLKLLVTFGALIPVALWLCWAILSWLSVRIDRELRWYMVTDRSLRVREGIWLLREMTITFANVQNVSVSQGPLQRHFGVADVVVQTAGGGGSAGAPDGGAAAGMHIARLRGLADAEAVRDFIHGRVRAAVAHGDAGAGLGDPASAARATADSAALMAALRQVADEAAKLRAQVS